MVILMNFLCGGASKVDPSRHCNPTGLGFSCWIRKFTVFVLKFNCKCGLDAKVVLR